MDPQTRQRYHLIDGIRGSVLLSMIAYHFAWNMVYLYGIKWKWYHSMGAYIWQQSICWIFILVSGFCWSMGRKPFQRGMTVFGGGVLVTAVTMAVMPSNRVIFGILTCIGSCMLLLLPFEHYFRKVPPEMGISVSFAAFLLTRNVNQGFLGFEGYRVAVLPKSLYCNLLTAYLGMPPAGFYSMDYFSVLPWCFLFLTGYFLYAVCGKYGFLQWKTLQKKLPIVDFLGKHSLLIYLLHQPVIYGLQEILDKIGML